MATENIIYMGTGFTQVPNDFLYNTTLSFESRCLFIYLTSFAFTENRVYPTLERIKKDTGWGDKKIRKYRNELEDKGYLVIKQAHENNGQFANNIYYLYPNRHNATNGQNDHTVNMKNVENSMGTENATGQSCPYGQIAETADGTTNNTNISNNIYTNISNNTNNTNKHNNKNNKEPRTLKDIIEEYTEDEELRAKLLAYIEMRRDNKKAPTVKALQRILVKLDRIGHSREDKLTILQNSIDNSWVGIFELKNFSVNKKDKSFIVKPTEAHGGYKDILTSSEDVEWSDDVF